MIIQNNVLKVILGRDIPFCVPQPWMDLVTWNIWTFGVIIVYTHYKELCPIQPTYLQPMSKSTIHSTIDELILCGTMVKMTCSDKNN
jgi:hypothetical protein